MKTGDKVVCIRVISTDGTDPIKGDIYTIDGIDDGPPIKYKGWYFIRGFNQLAPISQTRVSYNPIAFRPVDDTFGEVVAETIEKQIEVEQMETV